MKPLLPRKGPRQRLPHAAVWLCILAAAAPAQLPEPKLTAISPPGGRIGETISVKIVGTETERSTLLFSHPGIQASADAKTPGQFSVTIAPDVPAGFHDARILGELGISNPRRFQTGVFPEVDASPKALSRGDAQEIAPPCVVRGTALPSQTQWLKIASTPGVELVLECHAPALDSRMDPLLVLHDQSGRELARSRRLPIRWKPSDNQPLYLAVRDFLSNGGIEYGFRLHVGREMDAPPPVAEKPLLLWPLAIPFTPERNPNDLLHPQKISLPAEIRGRFDGDRDVDAFEFEAKQGEVWWLECVSNRLGFPTHPRVVVERVEKNAGGGESLATVLEVADAPWFAGDPDFDGLHFDPVGRFDVKKDGVHRVVVRDINHAPGGAHPRDYALSVRKPSPDFALVCAVQPPVANKPHAASNGPVVTVRAANLRRGQVIALRVMVVRRDGFSGPIRLHAVGLPGGVCAEPCVLGPGLAEGFLLLRASEDAAKWSGSIRIEGSALIDSAEVKHEAIPYTPVWDSTANSFIESVRNRRTAELALAVVDEPALGMAVWSEPRVIEAKPGEKVKVSLRVERSSPANAPLKLKAEGLPGIEKAKLKDAEIPATAEKIEYELDLSPLKLSPGTYTLCFRGEGKTKRDIKGKQSDVSVSLLSNSVILDLK